MQTFTSKATSINSRKAPAVYSMKKAIEHMHNKDVIDIGGGRFDTAISIAAEYSAIVSIYDPYNRSSEHNSEVLSKAYDVAVISNVLNVINDANARSDVLKLAASKAPVILITVYEGNKSGKGKQTAIDSWQENRLTDDYVAEISKTFPNWKVNRYGKLIIAEF